MKNRENKNTKHIGNDWKKMAGKNGEKYNVKKHKSKQNMKGWQLTKNTNENHGRKKKKQIKMDIHFESQKGRVGRKYGKYCTQSEIQNTYVCISVLAQLLLRQGHHPVCVRRMQCAG